MQRDDYSRKRPNTANLRQEIPQKFINQKTTCHGVISEAEVQFK